MTNTITTNSQAEKLVAVRSYAIRNMPKLPYHNFSHVEDVASSVARLAQKEGLNQENTFLLVSAAYMHDLGMNQGVAGHEERSAAIAGEILPEFGYDTAEIESIKAIILATKLGRAPKTHLEELISDADLANLGREDFFDNAVALQREFGVKDSADWYMKTYDFVRSHQYNSVSAKALYNTGKKLNLESLKDKMRDFPR